MKQKTAMQILLDSINKELESNAIKDTEYYGGLEDVKDYILENFLLEKEKSQIIDARMQDMDSGLDPSTYIDIAEEYYNRTYLKESEQ